MESPPPGLHIEFETLFNAEALRFLSDLCSRFQPEVDKVKKGKKMHHVDNSIVFVLCIPTDQQLMASGLPGVEKTFGVYSILHCFLCVRS